MGVKDLIAGVLTATRLANNRGPTKFAYSRSQSTENDPDLGVVSKARPGCLASYSGDSYGHLTEPEERGYDHGKTGCREPRWERQPRWRPVPL